MAIKYKIDVLQALKDKGYNTTRLRRDKIIGESYLTQLRHNELVSWAIMNKLCELLECDISDLIEYVKE